MSRIVYTPRDTRAAARLREEWAVNETRRLAQLGDRVALAELRALEARERSEPAPTPSAPTPATGSPAIAGERARLARAGATLVRLGLDPKLRPELRELAATMATLVRSVELVDQVDDVVPAIAAGETAAGSKTGGGVR